MLFKVMSPKHCIHGLAFSSLAALAPRMLVLRISRRSLRSLLEMRLKVRVFFVKRLRVCRYICVYKGLAEGLASYPHEKDIGFVRIDSSSVISGIRHRIFTENTHFRS